MFISTYWYVVFVVKMLMKKYQILSFIHMRIFDNEHGCLTPINYYWYIVIEING